MFTVSAERRAPERPAERSIMHGIERPARRKTQGESADRRQSRIRKTP